MKNSCPCRTRECRWSNVQIAEKKSQKMRAVYCDMCGVPLCQECGATGLCSNCTELWIAEIDLADMEAEEERA